MAAKLSCNCARKGNSSTFLLGISFQSRGRNRIQDTASLDLKLHNIDKIRDCTVIDPLQAYLIN